MSVIDWRTSLQTINVLDTYRSFSLLETSRFGAPLGNVSSFQSVVTLEALLNSTCVAWDALAHISTRCFIALAHISNHCFIALDLVHCWRLLLCSRCLLRRCESRISPFKDTCSSVRPIFKGTCFPALFLNFLPCRSLGFECFCDFPALFLWGWDDKNWALSLFGWQLRLFGVAANFPSGLSFSIFVHGGFLGFRNGLTIVTYRS